MNKPKSSVSIIIPCYNEENLIGHCLEALAKQLVRPHEIIVVDNNCTDNTSKLARKYGATVVTESTQGLIAARNKGFLVATGDIIAKLDADSRPSEDWILQIQEVFTNQSIQAATGTGYLYDWPYQRLVKAYRNFFAVWLNRLALGHHMLWGSNLAIRSTAWAEIKNDCCRIANIMEDLDIAAHINNSYGPEAIAYNPKMRVDISGRRAMGSLRRNWLYLKMWPQTLKMHGYERRTVLWPAIVIIFVSTAVAGKIARFYNTEQQRMIFSLLQWRSNQGYSRDNP